MLSLWENLNLIKGYLSGIQFFHKQIFSEITNSHTSLIKGIQRTQPTRPDARQSITLKILTKCISTLCRGFHSINTVRTLDAMFILAFYAFLRCSELTITSGFNPKVQNHKKQNNILLHKAKYFSQLFALIRHPILLSLHSVHLERLYSNYNVLCQCKWINSHVCFHLKTLSATGTMVSSNGNKGLEILCLRVCTFTSCSSTRCKLPGPWP